MKTQETVELLDYVITISTDERFRMEDVVDDELYWLVDFHVARKSPRHHDEILCKGHIKNDGCSNWHFDDCVHFCDAEEATAIGKVMEFCYKQAAYYTRDL